MDCIILARGGSKRIPNKNRKIFKGRPIIEYPIEYAKKTGLFNRIVVSSDCPEILLLAGKNMVRPHFRSTTTNDSSTMKEGLYEVLDNIGHKEDICLLYATAVLTSPRLIKLGYDLYTQNKNITTTEVGENGGCCGSWIWLNYKYLRSDKPLLTEDTQNIYNPVGIDIDTIDDWEKALKYYKEG